MDLRVRRGRHGAHVAVRPPPGHARRLRHHRPATCCSAGSPTSTWATTLAVLLPVLLIGLAMIGFRLQIVLMRELAQARETVAKLAANEERLRLARDMHDLTGQSLSMITLKSELAAKRLARLPSSAERDAVAHRARRHRPGQPADAARHQGGGQRLPQADARHRGHHGAERARGGRHRARRRRRADPAVGHVRPGRRGGAGLVPARGRHQRDPPLPRPALPDPAHRAPGRAVPRGHRRRPRLLGQAQDSAGPDSHQAAGCAACPSACPPSAAACRSAGRRARTGPRLPPHRHRARGGATGEHRA